MKQIYKVLAMVLMGCILLTSTGVVEIQAGNVETEASTEYVISKDGRFQYKVYETEEENYIHIYKYLGNEASVVIPDTMDGYIVRGLLTGMMYENESVEEIEIPNTLSYIDSGTFASAYALKNIYMEDGFSEAFHTEDGILYNGGTLHSYPPGKENTIYVVPNGVGKIRSNAFYGCVNLEKVIVPSNIDFLLNPFSRCKKPLDIIIKKENFDSGYLTGRCWQMLSGTRFLVANEELAEQYRTEIEENYKYIYGTSSNYYSDSKEPMEIDVYDPVPSTDLTFADGTKEKDITVYYKPDVNKNRLYTNLYEDGAYIETTGLDFINDFVQYPFDTTENVKWYLTDEDGTVHEHNTTDVALINRTHFTFTGYDESGHEIKANVTVYCPAEEFSLDTEEAILRVEEPNFNTKRINGTLKEEYSYAFKKGVTWEIADETVAKIIGSGTMDYDEDKNIYCDIQAISAGTTTLTATISDDGISRTETVEIVVQKDIKKATIDAISANIYTGEQSCPKPVVRYNNEILTEGTDYTVSYEDNVNVGSATVTVTGTGAYYGVIETYFLITNNIKDATVRYIPKQNLSDIQNGIYPEVNITLIDTVLTEGEDYTLTFVIADKNSGYVNIEGVNDYTGTQKVYFKIVDDTEIKTEEPKVTLTSDMITFSESIPMLQRIESGEIKGTYNKIWTTGEDLVNNLSVICEGKELVMGTDFTLKGNCVWGIIDIASRSSFIAGNYSLIITGIEEAGYTGTATIDFMIYDNYKSLLEEAKKEENGTGNGSGSEGNGTTNSSGSGENGTANNNSSNSSNTTNPNNSSGSTGNEVNPQISSISKTVAYGDKAFKVSSVMTVSGSATYKSSNKAVAKVSQKGKVTIKRTGYTEITVKDSTGTKVVKLYVKPKRVKLTYAVSAKKKTLTVKWKKDKTVTGYQIEYSTKKNFKNSIKVNVPKSKKTSVKIKNLKSKKRYYVRVAAYTVIDGHKYYGAYSKVKKVKVR
ncbi:MAG: fibronectin type III domain-containing protein [Lachnospiraceae bacterium]|nr:fibronectin type III domain-containing protein [Lachnospiraceae bacterium]